MTITEFLTARYDEREAAARAVRGREFASWNRSWDDGSTRDLVISGERVATLPIDMDEHIALNDPAYVLADIAAKRRMVELCATWIAEGDRHIGARDAVSIAARTQAITAETVLRTMLQPFAEHPDFDEGWGV